MFSSAERITSKAVPEVSRDPVRDGLVATDASPLANNSLTLDRYRQIWELEERRSGTSPTNLDPLFEGKRPE